MSPNLTRELSELIEALDRRLPRVEQAGEADIARDAAALRAKAVERLRELEKSPDRDPGSGTIEGRRAPYQRDSRR